MTNPIVLGTSGHSSIGGESFSSTHYFSNVGLGRCAMDQDFTSESQVIQTIRVGGAISYLSWGTDSAFGSGSMATLTLKLRLNAAYSSLAISISPLTTGFITDSTHSVNVVSGDTLAFDTDVVSSLTYNGSFYCVSARFDPSSTSAQIISATGPNPGAIVPTVGEKYLNFLGTLASGTGTETWTQFQSLAEGTWKFMACYVDNNTFSEETTFVNRLQPSGGSAGDGNMAVTYSASTGGYLEDTTPGHYDSVNTGDYLNYGFRAAASGGSGSLKLDWIGANFLASDSSLCMIGGSQEVPTTVDTTNYTSLFGGGQLDTSENRATGAVPYALTASNFSTYITQASTFDIATFSLLQNGAGSGLACASSMGSSGYLEDTTHTASFAAGDTCANEINVSMGTVKWSYAAVLLTS